MIVRQAKEMAHQWVTKEASKIPGFYGAFFAGSINWMSEDALFPSTSDLDIKVILEDSNPPEEIRKFRYQDVTLEVSYTSSEPFQSSERILSDYTIACHLAKPSIIADPSGQLARLQEPVSKEYTKRKWVRKRCEHARDWLITTLQWLSESDPLHDQVFAWIYASGIPNHIILTADLRNPTVRRMYAASRDVLAKYDCLSLHESILSIVGSRHMSIQQAEELFASCSQIFETAKQVVKTPFFYSSTISDFGRSIAIGGSRELIESGYYREAVPWITFIHTCCQKALYNDASIAVQQEFMPGYQHLLNELGLNSFADLQNRNEQLETLLPKIWEVTESIIAANPEITD